MIAGSSNLSSTSCADAPRRIDSNDIDAIWPDRENWHIADYDRAISHCETSNNADGSLNLLREAGAKKIIKLRLLDQCFDVGRAVDFHKSHVISDADSSHIPSANLCKSLFRHFASRVLLANGSSCAFITGKGTGRNRDELHAFINSNFSIEYKGKNSLVASIANNNDGKILVTIPARMMRQPEEYYQFLDNKIYGLKTLDLYRNKQQP